MYSEAALREGVLLDTMSRLTRRSRHVRTTCATCRGAASASSSIAATTILPTRSTSPRLAVALFDAIPELRDLGPSAREYLEAGAMLANVGLVVAHSQHHLHAYYMIRNSELAGLTDDEIEVIAQIARYHRKSEPKQSHEPFAALSAGDQRLVRSLAAVLRVAIGLDRRHEGRVVGVTVAADDDGTLVIRRSPRDRRRHRPRGVRRRRTEGVARAVSSTATVEVVAGCDVSACDA